MIGSLVWSGVTAVQAEAMKNLLAIATPSNYHESAQLVLEVETFKLWLSTVKGFVDKLIKSRVNLCGLADFIDTVNAVQLFFYSNFLKPSTATMGFIRRYPEWYRNELAHVIQHVAAAAHEVLMELQAYDVILHDELLRDATLSELRKALKKHNAECARFGKYYREHYRNGGWDVCESCTVRDTRYMTLHEAYARTIKDRKKFARVKEAVGRGAAVPDVIIPPTYGQHGRPGLVGRLFGRSVAPAAHLGGPLRERVFEDDDDTESSEEFSDDES